MRHAHTTLLATTLGYLLGSAGEPDASKPPECEALKYLANPQAQVSIAATVDISTPTGPIIRDVEFDYDGRNVRGMHFERGRNVTSIRCIHEGRRYRYSQTNRRILTEDDASAGKGPYGPRPTTPEAAATTAMAVNSLGLGSWMPGDFEVEGSTIRAKLTGRPDIVSATGTATVDDAGLLRQLVMTNVFAEQLRHGLPASVHKVTYEYGNSPDIAPGFPSGWTALLLHGDRVRDRMTVTVHRWSNTPPSPDKFAPSNWAPQVDICVQPTPPALKPGTGPLQ